MPPYSIYISSSNRITNLIENVTICNRLHVYIPIIIRDDACILSPCSPCTAAVDRYILCKSHWKRRSDYLHIKYIILRVKMVYMYRYIQLRIRFACKVRKIVSVLKMYNVPIIWVPYPIRNARCTYITCCESVCVCVCVSVSILCISK